MRRRELFGTSCLNCLLHILRFFGGDLIVPAHGENDTVCVVDVLPAFKTGGGVFREGTRGGEKDRVF